MKLSTTIVFLLLFIAGGLARGEDQDPQPLLDRARSEALAQHWEAAEADYRSALALVNSPASKFYVGTVLQVCGYFLSRNSVAEARDTLNSAAERQKRDSVPVYPAAPILVALAEAEETLKLWSEQAETLGNLAEVWTKSEGAKSSIVTHFRLAQAAAYDQAGRYQEAQESMTQAIAALTELYGQRSIAVYHASNLKNRYEYDAVRSQGIKVFGPPDLTNLSSFHGALLVGRGVSSPKLISKVEPRYPAQARRARYAGTVVLKVVVGADGHVGEAEVITPLGLGLDEEAIEAVKLWTFKPGEKNGEPVPVVANIEVNFHLL